MALWPDQAAGSRYFGIPSVLLLHVVYHFELNGNMNVILGVQNDHVAAVNGSYANISAVLVGAGKVPQWPPFGQAPFGQVLVLDSIKHLGAAIS